MKEEKMVEIFSSIVVVITGLIGAGMILSIAIFLIGLYYSE